MQSLPSSVTGFYDDYPATKCDYWTESAARDDRYVSVTSVTRWAHAVRADTVCTGRCCAASAETIPPCPSPPSPPSPPRPQCPTAFYCICIRTCMYVAVCRSLKSAARLPTPRRVPSADRLLPPPTTHRRHLKEVFFLLCSIFLTTSRADFSVLSMKISQLSSRSAEAVFRQSILDWPESNCVFFWGRGGEGRAETIFLWETKNLLENIYWRSCVQKSSCLFQKWFDILVSEWNLANQF